MSTNNFDKLANKLSKSLEQEIRKDLNIIGDILVKETHQNIFDLIYNDYDPSIYNRTYDLINGVTKNSPKKNAKSIEIDVYMDDNKVMGHLYNNPTQPLEPYAEKVEKGEYDFDYPYDYNKPR